MVLEFVIVGDVDVDQQTPLAVTVASPWSDTVPPDVAVVAEIEVAAEVADTVVAIFYLTSLASVSTYPLCQ
jgi:hypothetical protein